MGKSDGPRFVDVPFANWNNFIFLSHPCISAEQGVPENIAFFIVKTVYNGQYHWFTLHLIPQSMNSAIPRASQRNSRLLRTEKINEFIPIFLE